jgi:tetratricopeptide (TPR) repeat protein
LYATLSLGPAATFGLGFAGQLSMLTRSAAVWLAEVTLRADRYVGLFDYYAAGLFLLLALTAVVLMTEGKSLPSAWAANRWSLVALAPVALVACLCINVYDLNPIRADMIYQRGQVYDMLKDWDFAIALYKHAIRLTPDEDVYYRGLGRAFLEKGALSRTGAAPTSLFDEQSPLEEIWQLDAEQTAGLGRDDLFYAARAVFARGRAINPLNADHTAGLALVYQRWATLTTDPAGKSRLAEQSGQYYAQAVRLMPRDAKLWNEWTRVRQMRFAERLGYAR